MSKKIHVHIHRTGDSDPAAEGDRIASQGESAYNQAVSTLKRAQSLYSQAAAAHRKNKLHDEESACMEMVNTIKKALQDLDFG